MIFNKGNDVAIDKDKVFELFGRYWEIAYNEGRTGEGFPDIANDVLAELRDALDADDGDVFTGQLVEIDGHTYGLRPGAARVVREALRDAHMLDFMIRTSASIGQVCGSGHWVLHFWPTGETEKVVRAGTPKEALEIAMAKDGA